MPHKFLIQIPFELKRVFPQKRVAGANRAMGDVGFIRITPFWPVDPS
jgi:hypothetical protein